MILDLLSVIVLVVLMMLASGAAVAVFEKLVHEVKVSKLLLATILVGFSTSLPELTVGIESAIRGQSQLALGNLVGANLANVSWIIGVAALLAGSIPVVGEYLRKDLWVTLGAAMTPFMLMSDGLLSRMDGLILIVIYLFYVLNMVKNGSHPLRHLHISRKRHPVHHRLKTEVHWVVEGVVLVLSLAVLATSSWMLINIATKLAEAINVSFFWIGLLVIALGTTLPELILSISAVKKRDVSLILGNVLGSVVVNSTLILGIVALLGPISYPESAQRGVAGIFLIVILGLFWLFTRTKHKLDRWEGAILIGVYVMFVGVQLFLA